MKRQVMMIGSHQYMVDFIQYDEGVTHTSSKYVLLRRYDMINDLPHDTDILLISKERYERWLDGEEVLPWPSTTYDGAIPQLFNSPSNFVYGLNKENIKDAIYNIYTINNNVLEEADVYEDTIRVWHPQTNVNGQFTLYVNTYFNNVHWHILCDTYSIKDKSNVSNEWRYGHGIYSEYVDFMIPSLKYLLSQCMWFDNMSNIESDDDIDLNITYFNEDGEVYVPKIIQKTINNQEYELLKDENKAKCTYIGDGKWEYKDMKILDGTYILSKLSSFKYPYHIIESDGTFTKHFVRQDQDMKSWLLNVTLSSYSYIDENNLLFSDEDMDIGFTSFNDDMKFILKGKTGFINGELSIIGEFEYPLSSEFSNFQEAYEYVNDVSLKEYEEYVPREIDEEDDDITVQKQLIMFICTIAKDSEMREILWTQTYQSDKPDVFSISLGGIFSSYNEIPSIMYVQIKFIDRWCGIGYQSQPVALTKEKIKYMINDNITSRVNSLVSKQENDPTYNIDWLHKQYNKDIEMDLTYFNFIDKIKCNIIDKSEISSQVKNSNKPKVLYKPVFYHIQDLQNIKIHKNLIQNIGINLSSIMTKIDTFSIKIGDYSFIESYRNDVYVIFKIDGSKVSDLVSGTYHIVDDEGVYISSGNYNVIE